MLVLTRKRGESIVIDKSLTITVEKLEYNSVTFALKNKYLKHFLLGVGRQIHIRNDVVMCINSIRGGQVRLEFEADKSVTIDREEIHIRKQNDTR